MTMEDKFLDLLTRLLKKSQANQVNWTQAGSNAYCVHVSNSIDVFVFYRGNEEEGDWARAELYRDGREILGITAEDTATFDLISSLYNDAKRCETGVDVALQVLETAVASDTEIGLDASPRQNSGPPDEDIPF